MPRKSQYSRTTTGQDIGLPPIPDGGEEEALRNLREWLDGLTDHPLLRHCRPPAELVIPVGVPYAWWRSPILTTLDTMIEILERAAPDGLHDLRRRFQEPRETNPAGRGDFYNLRAEMAVAASFAEAGLDFAVNTQAGPDLLIDAPSGRRVGVEISHRGPDALGSIAMDVLARLNELLLDIKVSLMAEECAPASIRTPQRRQLADAIVEAAEKMVDEPFVLVRSAVVPDRPERDVPPLVVRVQITPLPMGAGVEVVSSMTSGAQHTLDAVAAVAQQPLRSEQKRAQARRMPTLLIADITHLDGTAKATIDRWPSAFASEWNPEDPFVALAAMHCPLNHLTPCMATSINPHADPLVAADVTRSLKPVAGLLRWPPMQAPHWQRDGVPAGP
ncbi:hypothetical protein [Streptacidiphilus sp. P02-A3a]|uniref:hypothetical protein n=1 Tax=Streptacidiphilus sp. P02-A3a TaxID=2704468 RepID=UPI0015FCFB6B|nr:hypothetical protein [Streptacidiphilus sp. P02-A3a]QMU71841.1 hypothetical protein GXP74_29985 [Streptacidiphilus sp. P02-A3a]